MGHDEQFFIYIYCNDLDAMRRFYSKLVGLDELYYSNEGDGALGYRHGSVQFTILPSSEENSVEPKWHRQPGWSGGSVEAPSWSFQMATMEAFRGGVERLQNADIPTFDAEPKWRGYWSFPVKDLMGNTVELTFAPADEPDEKDWVR